MLGYFMFEGGYLFNSFTVLLDTTINAIKLDLASALKQLSELFAAIVVRVAGSIAAMLIITTLVAIVAQTGPLLAPEAIKSALEKLNPLVNAKQMFSMHSLFEFGKSIAKVEVLSLIFFYLIRQYAPSIQFYPCAVWPAVWRSVLICCIGCGRF
jgi:type III secretion protein U